MFQKLHGAAAIPTPSHCFKLIRPQQHLGSYEKMTGGPQQVNGTQANVFVPQIGSDRPVTNGGESKYVTVMLSVTHDS